MAQPTLPIAGPPIAGLVQLAQARLDHGGPNPLARLTRHRDQPAPEPQPERPRDDTRPDTGRHRHRHDGVPVSRLDGKPHRYLDRYLWIGQRRAGRDA